MPSSPPDDLTPHAAHRTLRFAALTALVLLGSVSGSIVAAERSAAARPNIVLIVTDDMGYGDCSSYGNTDLQTPFMDAIGRNGVRFTQFRVNPLCAPTRASIMTGLYSLAAGMWRGPGESARGKEPPGGWPADERRIADDIVLLPQLLQRAGYVTGMFGKWHLGYDEKNVPNARGFDHFVGFLSGAHPYWLRANSRIEENGKPLKTEGHATDLFADRAIAFIRASRGRPFFCYLPFNAVHGPLRNESRDADSAKPEWLDYYAERGVPQPRRDYNAVMTHADHRIGDVLKTLRELGLEQNTLVVCVSDNGGILHTYPSNNGPLRGGKGEAYEGGIRVPAVMQWPAVIPAGTVSRADAAHFDLFATLLDAAGVPIPAKNGQHAVQGISLLPHARTKGTTALPDRYLFWDLYGQCGALHGRWKLVGEIGNHHGRFAQAVRDAEKTKFELYDLEQDIGEKNDLSAGNPAVYADLKQRHLDWLRQFARETTVPEAATANASPESTKERKKRPRTKGKAKAIN
jgi:arylsulfatase A-like enzyme